MSVYKKSNEFGGDGGDAFSDDLTQSCRLTRVRIQHGKYVDGIQMSYVTPSGATVDSPYHGGSGGDPAEFSLAANEYIVRVEGRSDKFVDQLTFITSLGNRHGPYGRDGGEAFEVSNLQVGGFFGRSGRYLDAIGFFTVAACP